MKEAIQVKMKRYRSHTKTAEVLAKHSLEEVRKAHFEYGIYKAAKLLETDPSIVRYLALREGWKRPLPNHLHAPYFRGEWTNLKTNYVPDNIKPNKSNDN